MISAQAASPGGTRTRRAGAPAGLATPWALLAALAGGAALYASFPPVGAWPLAVLGPALLVVALAGRSLRASLACGLAFGLALFVPLLSWLVNVAWYAWGALAAAEAVVFAVLAVGQRLLLRTRWWPAAVAGWWVAAEAVRDRWPFPFPWGRLAMSQAGAPDAHWIAVGGAPLLSFLIALAGAMAGRAALAALRRPAGRRPGRAGPALAAAVTAGLVLAGGALPVDPVAGAPRTEVAAIQGN
ncbi:MAG TPA: apolipoprotein N-acyltransferase, partial [Streptosporangiaceae bacterium]|nr:apolipoprotein N-acyltransferase [Streptosporangiaceae bacterium]